MLQDQVIAEIKQIPADKLMEVYQLIHYFRLGLLHEQQQSQSNNNLYPLRGTKIEYKNPTEPVATEDWDVLT